MILISHRGNINGPQPDRENRVEYIETALAAGYQVEIDIWGRRDEYASGVFLGHDGPERLVSMQWLRQHQQKLWVHAKNYIALNFLINDTVNRHGRIRFFFHEKERYSLIGNTSLVWCHDISEANNFSIVPLLSQQDISLWDGKKVFGICSDYVEQLRMKK